MITSPFRPLRVAAALLFTIALLPASPRSVRAQIPDLNDVGGGTRYILAFPDTAGNKLDPQHPNTIIPTRYTICIYSASRDNHVRIVRGNGQEFTVAPTPGRFTLFPVSPDPVVTSVGTVSRNSITVESLQPIIVYCIGMTAQGMDAWTPLPVDRWGKQYSAAALPGDYVIDIGPEIWYKKTPPRRPAPGSVLVIAAYDNTQVTITAGSGQRFAGGESTVRATLRRGECYQVKSLVDTTISFDGDQADLAGTRVIADRPVGVISGNTRALVRPNAEGVVMNVYKNIGMEWLAPVDEHGSEFVYMPSWDIHRPGINSSTERAGEIVRIYGTTAPSMNFTVLPEGAIGGVPHPVMKDTIRQVDLPANQAVRFRTSAPAQAYMHSSSIVHLISRNPCYQSVCESYEGWAPYMVELVPREQWTSFAPYYTPDIPAETYHYINVVTDTVSARSVVNEDGDPFPFQWKIPGTDLIWGTMMIGSDETHYLLGRDGARFSGFVYGLRKGAEYYQGFKAGKKENPGLLALVVESSALSYAYPLVALRNTLAPPDDYRIVSSDACGRTTVSIRSTDPAPAGIRSIALDPALSSNTKIVPITPADLFDANGLAGADLLLVPIDPLADAHGRLVIRDRTGGVWSVGYSYQAARLALDGDSIDFGERSINIPADTVITIVNPLDADVAVNSIALDPGSNGFTIAGTLPDGPALPLPRPVTLRRGDTITVRLHLAPTVSGEHHGSLAVAFGCAGETLRIPLHAMAVEPVIMVPDLSFGTLRTGSRARTLELDICNVGKGHIAFDPGSPLDLRGAGFAVTPADLEQLKSTSIGPGECFTLHVTFDPVRPGSFSARARFVGNVRRFRDTSIWSAVVADSAGLGVEESSAPGYMLGEARPNPSGGRVTIEYTLGAAGKTTMAIHDGRGALVATLVDGMMSAGEHRAEWDAGGVAAGIYYCRITSGGWSGSAAVVVVR